MTTVTANARGVSPELKAALILDAEARGMSVSDVALQTLANHYGLQIPPGKGRRSTNPKAFSGQLNIRMPVELAALIYKDARVMGLTVTSVILRTLSEHYNGRAAVRERRRAEAETPA